MYYKIVRRLAGENCLASPFSALKIVYTPNKWTISPIGLIFAYDIFERASNNFDMITTGFTTSLQLWECEIGTLFSSKCLTYCDNIDHIYKFWQDVLHNPDSYSTNGWCITTDKIKLTRQLR